MRRWRMEVTFEEARAHLGIETQRHWNDWALARPTPALFGRYSLVALRAPGVFQAEGPFMRTSAWYVKERPPFSDALAVVRGELWGACHFARSAFAEEMVKLPRSLFERVTNTVCYAA